MPRRPQREPVVLPASRQSPLLVHRHCSRGNCLVTPDEKRASSFNLLQGKTNVDCVLLPLSLPLFLFSISLTPGCTAPLSLPPQLLLLPFSCTLRYIHSLLCRAAKVIGEGNEFLRHESAISFPQHHHQSARADAHRLPAAPLPPPLPLPPPTPTLRPAVCFIRRACPLIRYFNSRKTHDPSALVAVAALLSRPMLSP